ncbi:MAG: hypothetical protein IJ542_03285 [Clostridia bacterium]|nr:hypothetical protein [Clostridia bacterium]
MENSSKVRSSLSMSTAFAVISLCLAAVFAVLYCFFDEGLKTLFLVLMCAFVAASVIFLAFSIKLNRDEGKALSQKVKKSN